MKRPTAERTRAGPGPADRPLRLLLINPRFPDSFWSFRWAVRSVLPGIRALNPPLGLATVAALCPPGWRVTIVDENIETLPLDPAADIIGVGGMAVQFERQRELLRYYRRRGFHVVAGGSYASLCPERYADLADTVVAGEAEYIWPRFCRDFQRGTTEPLYQEQGIVDLRDSPLPRFDLLALDRYATVGLQFSRGCPYRCEFCDIIVMFGRRPRTKPLEQVGRELDRLRSLGAHRLFFVDDNLIGHKAKAKALLEFLARYQRRPGCTLQLGTEVSLNLAEDESMLRLFRAANFSWVFIGIESPDHASLEETGKTQNTRQDILGAVRTIYRHGIDILAGFIVGFDNDTLDTFEQQERFISASGIQVAMVGLLTALPKTPLYQRLEAAGRLFHGAEHGDNTRAGTNFVPLRMNYHAMVDAYQRLWRRLATDHSIALRVRNKLRYLRRPVYQGDYPWRERLEILHRFLSRGLLPGGPCRWAHFLYSLSRSAPRTWPLAISDWIAGLAIREYVVRHFGTDLQGERRRGENTLRLIRKRWAACLAKGALQVSLRSARRDTQLAITLRGAVDKAFFRDCARRLDRLLRGSAITLTLRIEALAASERPHLDRFLRRLARYGDRIQIRVSDSLHPAPAIDSSIFHVRLDTA